MARRALIVGTDSPAAPIADGLAGRGWAVTRTDGKWADDDIGRMNGIDLVVHADYPAPSRVPRPLTAMTPDEWRACCDGPLRRAIDLASACHPQLVQSCGIIVFVVPLMASAGGDGYTAMASLGEGCRILAKSLAKTWGSDGIRAHAVTLDPSAFLAPEHAMGIAEDNALHDLPLGRVPDPATDVAAAIESLTRPGFDVVTGSSLVIDGGLWMPG